MFLLHLTSSHLTPPPSLSLSLSLSFLFFLPPHSWLCHIDDDIYVNLKQLVKFLSKFDPKKEAVYFGRSGSGWETPRKVVEGALYGKPGQKYHFAVGGMYCLSRPILEMSKPYLMWVLCVSAVCVCVCFFMYIYKIVIIIKLWYELIC